MARTTNFADVIRKRLANDPALAARVSKEAINANIASQLYQLRFEAGLSQTAFGKLVGLKQPVIARLEDTDYQGHSLTPLKKVADALGYNLRVEFYKKPQYVYTDSQTLEWPAAEVSTEVSVTVNIKHVTTQIHG